MSSLDLFSMDQTSFVFLGVNVKTDDRQIYDDCINNAPYFGYQIEGKKWGVVQGCCNSWNCPRCGQQRAKEEYGRIVAGAREIGKSHTLTMLTITCRGRELSVTDAENNYLVWTNRLLTRLRTQTKRAGKVWAYASVTERQKRHHPHSHYLTTYFPPDAVFIPKGQAKYFYTQNTLEKAKHNTLQSEIVERACFECGLGWQYDISQLESVEGASRYVAKYLFKESIFSEVWPPKWQRVRYSRNWPKLPDVKGDAMVLLTSEDWHKLAVQALVIKTPNEGVSKVVRSHLWRADVIIQ